MGTRNLFNPLSMLVLVRTRSLLSVLRTMESNRTFFLSR